MEDNRQNRIDFSTVMYSLAGNFGGVLSSDDLKLRLKFFKTTEYSVDQIKMAGAWLLENRTQTFPAVPTTKEIIDAIKAITSPQLSKEAQAHKQCDIILLYLGDRGSSCDHVFKNASTGYLMGHRWGFGKLGDMTAEDLKWFRKDFVKAWIDLEDYSQALDNQIEYAGDVKKLLNIKLIDGGK